MTQAQLRAGRGKRCSKACRYKYATRRSGLTYDIKAENPSWFKEGHASWVKGKAGTGFHKEYEGWGVRKNPTSSSTSYKPGDSVGELNPRWSGDEASYSAIHLRLQHHRQKTNICAHCAQDGETQWANISHEYTPDLDDYMELCRKCHSAYDRGRSDMKRRWPDA